MSRRGRPARVVHERKLWHVIFFVDPLYLICAAAFVVGGVAGGIAALVRL